MLECLCLGGIKEKIHISLTTTDKRDHTTLTEQAEASIQISKDFATVMDYGCKETFRPELGRKASIHYVNFYTVNDNYVNFYTVNDNEYNHSSLPFLLSHLPLKCDHGVN